MCLSESGALARSGNFRDLGTEIGEANVKNLWNFWNPRYHWLFASYPQFLRQPGVIREQNLGTRGQRQGAVRSVSQGTLVRKLCSWESGEGETNTTATLEYRQREWKIWTRNPPVFNRAQRSNLWGTEIRINFPVCKENVLPASPDSHVL